MSDEVLYDDDTVRLDSDGVVIKRYYLPLARSKRIAYADIVAVDVRPAGWTTRWRLWGSTTPFTWLPLDMARHRKRRLVELDLGGRVRPVFTPDHPDEVAELIRSLT